MEYQVTLKCGNGKYKPVSCIITNEKIDLENKAEKTALINKGIAYICAKRYWTKTDLKKYNYVKAIVREYDKEKIKAENEAKYARIKEEKYASGEWKRPKNNKNN